MPNGPKQRRIHEEVYSSVRARLPICALVYLTHTILFVISMRNIPGKGSNGKAGNDIGVWGLNGELTTASAMGRTGAGTAAPEAAAQPCDIATVGLLG